MFANITTCITFQIALHHKINFVKVAGRDIKTLGDGGKMWLLMQKKLVGKHRVLNLSADLYQVVSLFSHYY